MKKNEDRSNPNNSKKTESSSNNAKSNNKKKRTGRWRKLLLYGFGILLIAGIIAGLWPKPVAVDTVQITRGPLAVDVQEEGKTQIRNRYVISSPVSGYLNRPALRAGSTIEAGKTVLATIEAEASGFLDSRTRSEARARLKTVESVRMQREAEVDRARAAYELAKKEFTRADVLKKEKVISTQKWDDAKTRMAVSAQELRSAEFALRAAEFEEEQARATLQQASAPGAEGSAPLQIIAPVDGTVLNVYEENSRMVNAGAPIMEIGNIKDIQAEIELLSSDAVKISPGAEATIEQWGGGTSLRGRVSLVEPGGFTKVSALGVEEQRVKVRVDFIEPIPAEIKLGDRYRVEASIETWSGDNVLQIPVGALFRRGNDWITFIVKDGKAHLQKVDIDHNNGINAEIISGLSEGDYVIIYPPDSIEDGSNVESSPRDTVE